ncbi:MAG: Putative periplasmic protein [uncultured Sulfurovum sp.]|uniref:Periplasmic protein n=1 Tax=uncultured Sulfurovum sp. TaxID=269237 RepID=A0A6S6TMD6_9BACT|nr:MAG: Putative periplasmic protein [uncultured Sulfurovum sp.]
MLQKLILIPLLTLSFLFAIDEGNIKSEMTTKIHTITKILQDKTLSSQTKEERIAPTVDTIFDYQTMSKISLGKNWNTLSSSEQARFSQKFETKLKNSYFEKLELYTDEKVVVKALNKVKSTRIHLHTDIIGVDETYEIIYKFYKTKNSNDWLIYDVDITGVSIIQTYRKQFSEFLATKSFTELLESL